MPTFRTSAKVVRASATGDVVRHVRVETVVVIETIEGAGTENDIARDVRYIYLMPPNAGRGVEFVARLDSLEKTDQEDDDAGIAEQRC